MKEPFVDRVNELRHLNRALKYDGKETPVLVFTGIGGMGKTALRIAFEEEVLKPSKIPYAVLDYDGDPSLRPIEATLRTIRRQLGRYTVKTPVFDFLYARYFELSTGLKLSAKNFPPELEGVVSILEGIPGVGNVTQILHGLGKLGLVAKERLQHKEWLYRIRDLEPREVLGLLPVVLAEDLEEAMTAQATKIRKTSGFRIPLFFDAYETLSDSQIDDILHRKLLLLTPHLLRVILTRMPLPWEHQFPKEWHGKITHLPTLDDLRQDDAIILLHKKYVDNPLLQEHLYQLTGGFPLHLELCADICREIEEVNNKKPGIQDFEGAAQAKNLTEELVNRLLKQLTDNEQDLMGLAAYPRWVSEEILEVLSSVPESVPRIFRKFTSLSMFSPHAEIPDAYIIRKELRDCLLLQQRKERLWRERHRKLSQFHKKCWEETELFHHFREVLYHGFYENPVQSMEIFEEHFWKLLDKFDFGEAEILIEAVPIETLSKPQQRKVDYARARLFISMCQSREALMTAKHLFEELIVSETDEDALGQYFFYIGSLLSEMGEYEKALEYLQKNLAIRQKVSGEAHPDVARTYKTIGCAYRAKGEYDKALEYGKRSLAIRQKVSGEEHPDVAASLNMIGVVFCEKGEHTKVLEHLDKALAIRLKVYGEEHPRVADSYSNIGVFFLEQGEYEKALEYGEKSLNIRLKIFGEEHPDIACSYENIGEVYRDRGEYEKALEYHQKALAIFLKAYGEEHYGVACSYLNIGVLCYRRGEYRKALEYLQKSFAIRQKVFGEEHPEVAKCCKEISHTLWALKREDEALQEISHSVDIYCSFELWENAVEGLETFAQWLEEKARTKEAEEARVRAYKIRRDHNIT